MKIALLTYSNKPRGSVVHTWELAEALTQLGHTVCIYALNKTTVPEGNERSALSFRQPNCSLRLVPAAPAPGNVDALIKQRISEFVDFLAVEADKFDIYHAQDCIGANALLQLKQMGKVPNFVRTVHHVETYHSPYLLACQDKSIRLPDLCLCVSDRWQQVLRTDYGVSAMRVTNGVNLRRFSPHFSGEEGHIKNRYGLTGHPIYLTVGGIEPRKNSVRLLESFSQVRQSQPTAQLVIAGGETLFDYQDYRDAFFTRAADLDIALDQSLVITGVVPDPDLPVLYRCADVFCFPSVREGWGLVVLEAIAAGLPVLTSNSAPFTEFLSPQQAKLVSPTTVDEIAQGMIELSAPQQAKQLVVNSQPVLGQYSWEQSAQQHVYCYQRLLNSP